MSANTGEERGRKLSLDPRDSWVLLHFRRRLVMASGLPLARRLQWAGLVRAKAKRQHRTQLYLLAAMWEADLRQSLTNTQGDLQEVSTCRSFFSEP